GNDYSGANFARAPNISAVLGANYKIALPKGKLVLGGDVNTRSNFHFTAIDSHNPLQQHSGYTLVNLRASYIFPDERIKLTAFVDNATDKDYWQATQEGANSTVGRAMAAPRTIGASLQYDW
ncbi:MAG: TonB-dependent receptor, partial [Methylobacillus glycogenes]|nr:TonB-dependent receptor [Methylobacillus glycogenes]